MHKFGFKILFRADSDGETGGTGSFRRPRVVQAQDPAEVDQRQHVAAVSSPGCHAAGVRQAVSQRHDVCRPVGGVQQHGQPLHVPGHAVCSR